MSKEVKRYELKITKRYTGGRTEESARMGRDAAGRYALFSDYEAILAERDALKKDAERGRHARNILTAEAIETAQAEFIQFGTPSDEAENIRADQAIDAALQGAQP